MVVMEMEVNSEDVQSSLGNNRSYLPPTLPQELDEDYISMKLLNFSPKSECTAPFQG
jgi:hypothetical protein